MRRRLTCRPLARSRRGHSSSHPMVRVLQPGRTARTLARPHPGSVSDAPEGEAAGSPRDYGSGMSRDSAWSDAGVVFRIDDRTALRLRIRSWWVSTANFRLPIDSCRSSRFWPAASRRSRSPCSSASGPVPRATTLRTSTRGSAYIAARKRFCWPSGTASLRSERLRLYQPGVTSCRVTSWPRSWPVAVRFKRSMRRFTVGLSAGISCERSVTEP
jgi:hypothetical protein